MNEALTPREKEVLDMLLEGVSPKEIAYKLNVSRKTIDFHKTKLYTKLDVKNIQELLARYNLQNSKKQDIAHPAGKSRKFRISILAVMMVSSVLVILVLLFLLLKPAASNETETPRTFNTIHLQVGRFTFENGNGTPQYMEFYVSQPLNFIDLYDGDFDDFIHRTREYEGAIWSEMQISGWVD